MEITPKRKRIEEEAIGFTGGGHDDELVGLGHGGVVDLERDAAPRARDPSLRVEEAAELRHERARLRHRRAPHVRLRRHLRRARGRRRHDQGRGVRCEE